MELLIIIILACLGYGITYDCIPIGSKYSDGFYSETDKTSSECKSTISNYQYLIRTNFTEDLNKEWIINSLFFNDFVVFNSLKNYWLITSFISLLPNATVIMSRPTQVTHQITFYSNSKLILFDKISFKKNIKFNEIPLLNFPQIISWSSNLLELHKSFDNYDGISIETPNINQCFDFISLRSMSSLNSQINKNIINKVNDFPYDLPNGKLYLLSNNRLLRFCPSDIELNNEVICTLNGTFYQNYYSGSGTYTFTQPHCPCDDAPTNCILKVTQEEVSIGGSNGLSNTIIHANHNLTLFNLKRTKWIKLDDFATLKLISAERENLIKTSCFTILNKGGSDALFLYNALEKKLTISGINELYHEVTNDKKPFTIIGDGVVDIKNSIDGIVYVFKGNSVGDQLRIHLSKKGSNQLLIFDEGSYLDESPFCSHVILKPNNVLICEFCKNGYILTHSNHCFKDKHCLKQTPNKYCNDCEMGFKLNVDGICERENSIKQDNQECKNGVCSN